MLAQLYRLGSSVAVCQLLRRLSAWAPPGVTGLLPGRGAQTVGYRTQFWLEKALILRERLSGATLDLVKCFNNISWKFGFKLLRKLGVPPDLLNQYIASLRQLVRWWQISGDLVLAGGHSTGYPEGDVWSVLIMVGLAALWVCYVTNVTSPWEDVNLSAYADNWSWAANFLETHAEALRATATILKHATLSVDWRKHGSGVLPTRTNVPSNTFCLTFQVGLLWIESILQLTWGFFSIILASLPKALMLTVLQKATAE